MGLYAGNLIFMSLARPYPEVGPAGVDHFPMVRCDIDGRQTDRGNRLRVNL